MKFETLGGKFLRNLNDFGLGASIYKSFCYLFKALYENNALILYKIDLDNFIGKEIANSKYIFKLVSAKDKGLLNQIEKMDEWLHGVLEGKLLSGGICMVIIDNDKVVGHYLAAANDVILPILKLKVILGSNEVWGEQITIHKDYRRKNLATELKNQIYIELKARGMKSIYGHVAEYNKASLKSLKKFSPKQLVKVQHTKFFNYGEIRFAKLLSSHNGKKAEFSKGQYMLIKHLKYKKNNSNLASIFFNVRVGEIFHNLL